MLRRKGVVDGRADIIRARVPIIKCVVRGRGGLPSLKADISVGTANGVAAVGAIKDMLARAPSARPLVLATKALLRENDLNEVSAGLERRGAQKGPRRLVTGLKKYENNREASRNSHDNV